MENNSTIGIPSGRIVFHINNTLKTIQRHIDACLQNPERYREALNRLYDMKAEAKKDLNSVQP